MSIIEAKKYKAMRPGKVRIFLRTFVPWQIVKFILINIKMTKMILKSHGGKNTPVEKRRS